MIYLLSCQMSVVNSLTSTSATGALNYPSVLCDLLANKHGDLGFLASSNIAVLDHDTAELATRTPRMKAHSSTTSPLEIPQISNIKLFNGSDNFIDSIYILNKTVFLSAKKHIHHIKLLHCNSSCLPLPRLKLAIEITKWISTFDVFYRVLSFSFLFPIFSFLKCPLFCCFGAWSSAVVVVLIPKPQKPQIPPPQVTGLRGHGKRSYGSYGMRISTQVEPQGGKIMKDKALECTGNWSILKLSCRWLCKSGYRHMRPRLAVTAACKSPLKTLKTFPYSALWDPLLCLLRCPDAPKGLKTRGCLVHCLDVSWFSWCEMSRNP